MSPATPDSSIDGSSAGSITATVSTNGGNPLATATEELASNLVNELRRRWRSGETPAAEELLSLHPELVNQPEAAVELIYEEYCLRLGAGHQNVEQDLLRRFPRWADPLRLMLDCHQLVIRAERERVHFPTINERVGDFRLLAELGHGARGRVFLATQTGLADRPVVLKITPLEGSEHLSLAKLQHTNIVPLYSAIDDPVRNIRILCMPYFGRVTLASLHSALATVPQTARTGADVLAAIDRVEGPSSQPSALAEAVRQMLSHASYAQAICWITACLVDALDFAHERGVVHLDLKPSNVLLAMDGQPMLLDFHLARGPIRPNGPLPENLGGSPPYMAPEQEAVMQSLRNGGAVTALVDRRADVYAMGVILYESLGGTLPISPDSPPLARLNPRVSTGLSDIVEKCLAGEPDDRYLDAAALADDLRRYLTDQPLAGVPNRSIGERWSKFRRRRPNRIRAAVMLAATLGAVAILLASMWWNLHGRHEQAELALHEGQKELQSSHEAEAIQTFGRGLAILEYLPFQQDLRQQLQDRLSEAKRLQLIDQLHQLADEVRVLYLADSLPADRLRTLATQCDAVWLRRARCLGILGSTPPVNSVNDLREIAIFAAIFRSQLATVTEPDRGRREASRILDEAQTLLGPSAVLDYERSARTLTSSAVRFDQQREGLEPLPLRSVWEHCVLGRALLASGDLPRASLELQAALRLEPAGRWPNFYFGVYAYRAKRYEDAVAAFSTCIGSEPSISGYFYNRALAYTSLGRLENALADYDRALELDPASGPSALNRGMLHFQRKHFDRALADLQVAATNGINATTINYNMALIHHAAQNPAAALHHIKLSLKKDPANEKASQFYNALQPDSPVSVLGK